MTFPPSVFTSSSSSVCSATARSHPMEMASSNSLDAGYTVSSHVPTRPGGAENDTHALPRSLPTSRMSSSTNPTRCASSASASARTVPWRELHGVAAHAGNARAAAATAVSTCVRVATGACVSTASVAGFTTGTVCGEETFWPSMICVLRAGGNERMRDCGGGYWGVHTSSRTG